MILVGMYCSLAQLAQTTCVLVSSAVGVKRTLGVGESYTASSSMRVADGSMVYKDRIEVSLAAFYVAGTLSLFQSDTNQNPGLFILATIAVHVH
jgi:hypothetical protein